jgi:pimeloyl-ACP methyl ester carboxylesterase
LATVGWTSLPWLWTLPQPTLVLHGRDDPIVPLANARILAALIPNARLRIFDDGHLLPITRPADVASVMHDFLIQEGV